MQSLHQAIVEGIKKNIPLTEILAGLGGAADKRSFYKAVAALIETGEIPNVMVCWCGIDCTRCRTFRATVYNDEGAREAASAYYQGIGQAVAMEDIHCFGGHSDEVMAACAGCPYMRCGQGKGLNRCDACGEHPCESLRWYTDAFITPSIGRLIDP